MEYLEIFQLEENNFYYLCEQMIEGISTYFNQLQIIRITYLYKVKKLNQSASRFLLSSLLKMAQKFPRVFVDSFLIPLFFSYHFSNHFFDSEKIIKKNLNYNNNNNNNNNDDNDKEEIFMLNNAQGEVINRVIKDSLPKTSPHFLSHFLRLFLNNFKYINI